jgi:hypothetical protein
MPKKAKTKTKSKSTKQERRRRRQAELRLGLNNRWRCRPPAWCSPGAKQHHADVHTVLAIALWDMGNESPPCNLFGAHHTGEQVAHSQSAKMNKHLRSLNNKKDPKTEITREK